MNKIHSRRLFYVIFFIFGLTLATSLILYALKQNINVFLTPSDVYKKKIASSYHFRLGGMVKKNSLIHDKASLDVQFVATDYKKDIIVRYNGILPDLFREGKGVIAEGMVNTKGEFIANLVLAKHDENYMPKTVYERLRKEAT